MYNRQNILMRKPKQVRDKNHTFQQVEETKAKVTSDFKKQKKDTYHNYLRTEHFGTRDEKLAQQKMLKREADLQLNIRQQVRAEEKAKTQKEDRQMLFHLKHELQREAKANQQKKENLKKISNENKHTAVFQKNVKRYDTLDDKVHEKRAVENHDLGYKISFY